jgi:hypothetical protein
MIIVCMCVVVAVTIAGVASCGDTARGFCDGHSVLRAGWERGFGPAVSIRVVALAKAKGSAAFGGNS